MTSNKGSPVMPTGIRVLLDTIEKSEEVEEKIADCATELATVNETTKKELIAGMTLKQAKAVLAKTESVEDKVEECADELHEINEALSQEIIDRNALDKELKKTRQKLSATKQVLTHTESNLAIAHEVAEQTTQRSLRDFVTGIPNRELFTDRLEQAIALAERGGWILGLMFIDLDKFKLINDTHGHEVGDRVLQGVAKRLNEKVRSGDTICRYGGDEFLYLLVNPQNLENIGGVARKVLDSISRTLNIDDLMFSIKPSIGIAVYPNDGKTGQELVMNADAAMYRAKKTNSGYVFFEGKK